MALSRRWGVRQWKLGILLLAKHRFCGPSRRWGLGLSNLRIKSACDGMAKKREMDPLHEQAHKNDHFHHFSSNSRKSPVSGRFHAKVSPERKQTGVFYVSNAFVCGLRSILRLKIGIFYHFFQELVKWLWRMGFEFHAAIVKFRSRWTQIIKNDHLKYIRTRFMLFLGFILPQDD